jgi:hypothetical protein
MLHPLLWHLKRKVEGEWSRERGRNGELLPPLGYEKYI